jgi:hypothetical protein
LESGRGVINDDAFDDMILCHRATDARAAARRCEQVARLYVWHRVDLGLALASDQWIVARTNDIGAVLWTLSKHALETTWTGCVGIGGGSKRRSGCTRARPRRLDG